MTEIDKLIEKYIPDAIEMHTMTVDAINKKTEDAVNRYIKNGLKLDLEVISIKIREAVNVGQSFIHIFSEQLRAEEMSHFELLEMILSKQKYKVSMDAIGVLDNGVRFNINWFQFGEDYDDSL